MSALPNLMIVKCRFAITKAVCGAQAIINDEAQKNRKNAPDQSERASIRGGASGPARSHFRRAGLFR
jgi:hypothetical protein